MTKKKQIEEKDVADEITSGEPVKRRRVTAFTKKKLTRLLDLMLRQFAEQIEAKPLTYTAGDGLKLMQMRDNAEPERPTEVLVGWVEEPKA